MSRPVMNLDELEYTEFGKGGRLLGWRGRISARFTAGSGRIVASFDWE
jgi:hypothetical protein